MILGKKGKYTLNVNLELPVGGGKSLHEWVIESLIQLIVQTADRFSKETPLCVAQRRKTAVALFGTIFVD